MDVKSLFKGIAVIIDNEIYKEDSAIKEIRSRLEQNNIPVVTYEDIPDTNVIPSFSNAAFVILDWDYFNSSDLYDSDTGERVLIPDSVRQEKRNQVLLFIDMILNKIFVPVFVFTAVNPETVIEALDERHLWQHEKPNRIFVKQKIEISNETDLFNSIEAWVRQMPSVYVLKEWEKVFGTTKTNMFNELCNYSPNWVTIIWDMLKNDSIECAFELGSFITKNLINRINQYYFEEQYLHSEFTPQNHELKQLIERERYLEYNIQPEQAYVGDLFEETNNGSRKYYLNIRAQCDLSRKGDQADLYLIKGKELSEEEIIKNDIVITSQGVLRFEDGVEYSLEDIARMCDAAQGEEIEDLKTLNSKFQDFRNRVFFNQGEILEKKTEAIIAYIGGGKIIKFRLDVCVKKFRDFKDKRIGRILPPHIGRIQQKCAQYMIREGTMPIPGKMFNNII